MNANAVSERSLDLRTGALPASGAAAGWAGSRTVHAVFFLSGAAALAYQLCWQRLLFVSFGIDIESVTIIVSTFMLGLGIGAWVGGRVADRWPTRLVAMFAAFELAIGLFGLASEPLIRTVATHTLGSPRVAVATVNFALLLIPTSLMGATLPILVTHAVRQNGLIGASIGRLYFVNTLGAALGTLALTSFGFRHIGITTTIWLAALVNFVVASSLAFTFRRRR
jgi:predicted membrane-bound spermidine synthase